LGRRTAGCRDTAGVAAFPVIVLAVVPTAALAAVFAVRAAAALRGVLVLPEAFVRFLDTLVLIAVFFAT
jgi:hypothetical protein